VARVVDRHLAGFNLIMKVLYDILLNKSTTRGVTHKPEYTFIGHLGQHRYTHTNAPRSVPKGNQVAHVTISADSDAIL